MIFHLAFCEFLEVAQELLVLAYCDTLVDSSVSFQPLFVTIVVRRHSLRQISPISCGIGAQMVEPLFVLTLWRVLGIKALFTLLIGGKLLYLPVHGYFHLVGFDQRLSRFRGILVIEFYR